MKSVDLFSCVGCHALGFQRAGIETIELCEIKPWRREVLCERFPGVPVFADIQLFESRFYRPDVVIGGPPCQGTSVAAAVHGYRSGRTLWPSMRRVIRGAEPHFVVVEQPTGNATWEAEVSRDLSDDGYRVARFEFGANDVGAPYIRRRVFLVACPSMSRLEVAWSALPSAIDRAKRAADARGDWDPDQIALLRVDDWRSEGVDDRRERIEALGDSNPPAMAEAIGHAIVAATIN